MQKVNWDKPLRLFVDTNVMIDLLGHRATFYDDAAQIFTLVYNKQCQAVVSTLSFATASYLLRKVEHKQLTRLLRQFASLVTISPVQTEAVLQSIDDTTPFRDIEDAMQHHIAMTSGCDVIITRDQKDFAASSLPVLTPKEFIFQWLTIHTC